MAGTTGEVTMVSLMGNITIWKYLKTLDAAALERTVGFARGRLDRGCSIVVLSGTETIDPDDVDLGASTRWSGGTSKLPAGANISTPTHTTIEHLLVQRGQTEADLKALKAKVCKFFALGGDNRPAKVLPNLRHGISMEYPDAEALAPGVRSGVMQFNLIKPKRFDVARVIPPLADHRAR
jgi:hypothetical protein